MRKVVEKKAATYDDAVAQALAVLGITRERAEVLLVQARDTDRRRPGPEEYIVRVWEREEDDDVSHPSPLELGGLTAQPMVCEHSAGSFDEAVRACLDNLGITEDEADIQVLQREDTNPLRSGPERITVRVWRRHTTEAVPQPDATGAERIQDVHAAAHLPTDDELNFEQPAANPDATA